MRVILLCAAGLSSAAAAIAQTTAGPDHAHLPVRPGSWSYTATAAGSEASFIDLSGTPQFVLRCIRANRAIVLSMRGVPASSILVWTSSASRTLPATYDAATSRVKASLAASDPLLDALAFSRGRMSFSAGGLSPVVLPAWPEPARAVEDCRN